MGGDDFDERIIKYLAEEFKTEGVDLLADRMALQLFERSGEKQIELSSVTTTNINLPFITATAGGPEALGYDLTR